MRQIKFRGSDMNGHYVYGLLTKKKIRNGGRLSWAIATGNCSLGETIPVSDSFQQLIAIDKNNREVYENDKVIRIADIDDEDFDIEKSFPMYATFDDYTAINNGEIVLVENES